MPIPDILHQNDPTIFTTHPLSAYLKDKCWHLTILNELLNFDAMQQKRHPISYEQNDMARPHVFANIGVSANIKYIHEGVEYLLLTEHIHEKSSEIQFLKLLSGYVEEAEVIAPYKAIIREIEEELIILHDNKIILRLEDKKAHNPYPLVLQGSKDYYYEMQNADYKMLGGLDENFIYINEKKLEHAPKLYVSSQTNSLQLVYDFELVLTLPPHVLSKLKFYHCEEIYDEKANVLNATVNKSGIYFMKLVNGKTSKQLFVFQQGTMIEAKLNNPQVSKVFDLKHNATQSHLIRLNDLSN